MPIFLQGDDAQAKQLTKFLGRAATPTFAQLAVDVTAYQADFTDNTTYMSIASSDSRFEHRGAKTIGMICELQQADTSVLFQIGSGATLERWRITTGDVLDVMYGVTTYGIFDITHILPASGRERILLAWAQEENPDTTGASDAFQSWFYVYNFTSGALDRFKFTHAQKPVATATTFVGGTGLGGLPVPPEAFWYETRLQSFTEIAVDWIETRTEPSTEIVTDHQGLPVQQDSGLGDAGELHGPAVAWSVYAQRKAKRRTLSAVWNERMQVIPTISTTFHTNNPKVIAAPGGGGWRMHLGTLRVYPVPNNVNRLFVRLHARAYPTSGEFVPWGLRVYSMNKLPIAPSEIWGIAPPDEPLEAYYVYAKADTDDTADPGTWYIDALLKVARGTGGIHKGMTYLMVAYKVDPDLETANDANGRLEINAAISVPGFSDTAGVPPYGGGPLDDG